MGGSEQSVSGEDESPSHRIKVLLTGGFGFGGLITNRDLLRSLIKLSIALADKYLLFLKKIYIYFSFDKFR